MNDESTVDETVDTPDAQDTANAAVAGAAEHNDVNAIEDDAAQAPATEDGDSAPADLDEATPDAGPYMVTGSCGNYDYHAIARRGGAVLSVKPFHQLTFVNGVGYHSVAFRVRVAQNTDDESPALGLDFREYFPSLAPFEVSSSSRARTHFRIVIPCSTETPWDLGAAVEKLRLASFIGRFIAENAHPEDAELVAPAGELVEQITQAVMDAIPQTISEKPEIVEALTTFTPAMLQSEQALNEFRKHLGEDVSPSAFETEVEDSDEAEEDTGNDW